MAIEILMPALSPTMETGTLATWNVAVGDAVRSGDVIAEIETDKATMEFEAVDEGTIASIAVDEGTEGVKVGTVIAMLAEEGDVRDARGGDGGMEVGRRIGGERQRVARAGLRGRRDSPLRVHNGAGACDQGLRSLRQLEEVLLVRRVHVEDDELH